MTDILFRRLVERFPIEENMDVSTYENFERIYLRLSDMRFKKAPNFNSHDRIKNLASRIFDVDFAYEKRGEIGPAIFFEPRLKTDYQRNHTNHHIEVQLPSKYPIIVIDTGNRGCGFLLDNQRDNYFKFVEETFNLFLNNTK